MRLDTTTLLLVVVLAGFLLSGLILLAAGGGRARQALRHLAGAYGLYGLAAAMVLGFADLGLRATWLAVWLTNVLFFLAYGLLWSAVRHLGGGRANWAGVLAGAMAWTLLCLGLWPWFGQALWLRVVVYCTLVIGYMLATWVAVAPAWRRHRRAVSPVLALLCLHALFLLYRMIAWLLSRHGGWVALDYTVINFEALLFAIGLAVSLLLMVRGRDEARYRHASLHDDLTGLPNRRALFERGPARLDAARDQHRQAMLLMCDLDHFKRVNDDHGHAAGDRVLRAFARIARAVAGDGDVVARLGGEEFVLLVPNRGWAEAAARSERLRERLALCRGHLPMTPTVSIGVACTCDAGYRLDDLLIQADRALYAAKAAGRDCVRRWQAELPALTTMPPVGRGHGGRADPDALVGS